MAAVPSKSIEGRKEGKVTTPLAANWAEWVE